MQRRRIIFVDIDGVLLPFPEVKDDDDDDDDDKTTRSRLFPSKTLKPLQRLWRHVTKDGTIKVEWILSSTWRVQQSYICDIERAVSEFGIPIEFDDITDPTLHTERQWEIYDWMEKQQQLIGKGGRSHDGQPSSSIWLALDDEELLEESKNAKHREFFQGHVIMTKSHIGLSQEDVNQAIKLWDKQSHSSSTDS